MNNELIDRAFNYFISEIEKLNFNSALSFSKENLSLDEKKKLILKINIFLKKHDLILKDFLCIKDFISIKISNDETCNDKYNKKVKSIFNTFIDTAGKKEKYSFRLIEYDSNIFQIKEISNLRIAKDLKDYIKNFNNTSIDRKYNIKLIDFCLDGYCYGSLYLKLRFKYLINYNQLFNKYSKLKEKYKQLESNKE